MFLIYSVVISKVKLKKISTKNILAIGRLFWETLYVERDVVLRQVNLWKKNETSASKGAWKVNWIFMKLCPTDQATNRQTQEVMGSKNRIDLTASKNRCGPGPGWWRGHSRTKASVWSSVPPLYRPYSSKGSGRQVQDLRGTAKGKMT